MHDSCPDILMIGAAVPQETMELLKRVDPMPQVQTYHLQWALIHAVENALGRGLRVFSTVPTRDWPYSGKALWPGQRKQVKGSGDTTTDLTMMPFVSVLGLKQITRFISCLTCTLAWFAGKRGGRRRVVLLYGLMISHLAAVLLLRPMLGYRVVAVVTDPPTPDQADESWVYRLARKLDRAILRWSLRQLDGIVPLAKPLADEMAPGVPACVMEGIISDEVVAYARSESRSDSPDDAGSFVLMYAGTLNKNYYGIETMLKAFRSLEDPKMRLWIFGRGHLESLVKSASAEDGRITYFGIQPSAILYGRMARADVLLNPRPVASNVTPYVFPSKLIEYMAFGRTVISGRLAGIPEEYHPFLVGLPEVTAQSLAQAIVHVKAWTADEREEFGRRAKRFVWENKTQTPQGEKVLQFLSRIAFGE